MGAAKTSADDRAADTFAAAATDIVELTEAISRSTANG